MLQKHKTYIFFLELMHKIKNCFYWTSVLWLFRITNKNYFMTSKKKQSWRLNNQRLNNLYQTLIFSELMTNIFYDVTLTLIMTSHSCVRGTRRRKRSWLRWGRCWKRVLTTGTIKITRKRRRRWKMRLCIIFIKCRYKNK